MELEEYNLFSPGLSGLLKAIVGMLHISDKLTLRLTCKYVKEIVSEFLRYKVSPGDGLSRVIIPCQLFKENYRFLLDDNLDVKLEIDNHSPGYILELLIAFSKKVKILNLENWVV
jgi:flagellar assembly factor FliW